MHHNQRLSYEKLRTETEGTIERGDLSKAEIARRLDKTRGAITRATSEAGGNVARLQRSIIELLTGYEVVEEPAGEVIRFRLVRKAGK